MARISRRGYIWIPPIKHPEWKIEVIRSDGTVDDVTDYIINAECTLGATEIIGDFRLEIDNSHGNFFEIWSVGNSVRIYADRNDGSTKIIEGRIEKLSYKRSPLYMVSIRGCPHAAKLLSITVTKSYTNQETSEILADLFSSYADEYDTSEYVEISGENLTISWNQKPFWECIIDLCNASGFDCYIDANSKVHYFLARSKLCTQEAVVHNDNLISVEGFGKDIDEVRNRIVVYGQEVEGMPIVATAEDSSSQSKYGIREEIITDTNIRSVAEARERANYELQLKKEPQDTGEVESFGLPLLKPGEMLMISDPDSNLNGRYRVISFSHHFGKETGMTTRVTIEKEPAKIPRILKQRFEREESLRDIRNPFEMRNCYLFTFDDDSLTESHNNTEVSDGKLVLQSGASSGTFVSIAHTASSNITSAHLKVSGSGLAGTEYWISVNNGRTWESISPETLKTTTSVGDKLKVKVKLNSSVTEIESLIILYK